MSEMCMANCMAEKIHLQLRKKQALVKLLTEAGLSLEDDYGKFHNVEMVGQLSKKNHQRYFHDER